MYLTVKQQLKHLTKEEYLILRELTHVSKNIANESMYAIRQEYFKSSRYLNMNDVYNVLKSSDNFKILNANMAQQIIRSIDTMYQSFFKLLKLKKSGYIDKEVHIPKYLDKDGFYTLFIQQIPKFKDNKFFVPYSYSYSKTHKRIEIRLPPILKNKTIKEIRIVPKYNARFFEVHYSYESEEAHIHNLDSQKALAIDLGIDNFATCVSSDGDSFIIDGKKLKSYNQWYNKRNSHLKSIKDKQHYGKRITNQQSQIAKKRNNRFNDYINKASKFIVGYCVSNNIGTLILGYKSDFNLAKRLSRLVNQVIKEYPFGKFKDRISQLCKIHNVDFITQEESYTSKASFFDNDDIPIYNKNDNNNKYTFSGKRVKRGLYITSNGILVNADVNGALNILKKSNVVPDAISRLYNSGELNTPVRIRLHK